IGDGALTGSTIEEIVIPASVTSIGRGAFAACTRLKTIAIPATVTEAGTHLLTGCTALTRVRVMSGAVPASAFAGCTALAEV
ncbi:leucine-rich repeat domain-containing protein, partial [Staphylococcus aureus]